LALLSAIIGGGIVGIPYAMLHTGIPLGILLNVFVAIAGSYTGYLYLKVKELSPTYVESLYELGFVTMGVCSIYFIAITILLSSGGCIMIYFIVFSNVSASIAVQIQDEGTNNIFTDRTIYVLMLAVVMLPLCLKNKLAEMKIVSILLFSAIALFIGLFLV
jgi:amino acid permease